MSLNHCWPRCFVALLFLLVVVPLALAQAVTEQKHSPPPSNSPLRVGLVLSGGGGRGLAHLGVLQWFEEHRIPVDYIAGTSMGGLVGATYAMGMSPAEIRALLKSVEWEQLFSGSPAFEQLAFRRKEDRRAFQTSIEVGYRNGLALPLGISSGHYLGLLIDRIALPYSTVTNFDELPIPYRAVATDFRNAEPLVMGAGSLASAMRATMSIPGVFPPVERNGKLLVDGGLVNNIPTDVIRALKPDVVIAVDVGTKLSDLEKIASLAGILQQSIVVMTIDSDRRNLRLADIIIAPELGDVSTLDFSRIDETAELGYQAAQAKARVLERFALPEAEWQSYLARRAAKRRTALPIIDEVRVEGVSEGARKRLLNQWQSWRGQPLDTETLEAELTEITGRGRYQSLDYDFAVAKEGSERGTLVIRAYEKSHAPPTLNFGVEIDGADINNFNFSLGSRMTIFDLGRYGSELRADVKLGFNNRLLAEYYLPLGTHGFFVAPRAAYRRDRQVVFNNGARLTEYQADRAGAGLDFGWSLNRRSELRFGYEYNRISARSRINSPLFADIDGNLSVARLRYAYDNQDSSTVPTRGLRGVVEVGWYFDAPNATQQFAQSEGRISFFQPLSSQGSFFVNGAVGTNFNRAAPTFSQFLLGGPFRLGAYNRDEFRVNHYAVATAGYLRRVYELPGLIGGRVYAGGWIDQAGLYDGINQLFDRQRYRTAGSMGVVLDTRLGPLSFIGSYGEGGRGKFYFSLGRFF